MTPGLLALVGLLAFLLGAFERGSFAGFDRADLAGGGGHFGGYLLAALRPLSPEVRQDVFRELLLRHRGPILAPLRTSARVDGFPVLQAWGSTAFVDVGSQTRLVQ